MKRQRKNIPFGFAIVNFDPNVYERVLIPVPLELESLIIAKWYLDHGYTNQSTRDWLVNTTNRVITVPGMRHAIKNVKRYKEILGYNPRPPEED